MTAGQGRRGAPDGLQTLDRALAILHLFQPDREEWSAAEVAETLGLSLGTVSRFMRGLAARGLLIRSGRRYRLGFAAIELGHRAVASLDLRGRLRQITVGLARDSGETCILLELDGGAGSIRVVDRAEPATPLRISVDIGTQLPISSGLGRTMLAYLPGDHDLLSGELVGSELAAELEEIRGRGWATSLGDDEQVIWGISVPIVTPAGVALGALAVLAPCARRSATEEQRLVGLLLAARADAERRLGFSGGWEGDGKDG